ncbi:uncharacterized protein [Diadema antillarum]|uniref:uncharacterized protein n=1 Tax=Diadema antillarum TaxID=105358 RepID=UPI003A85A02C
MKKFRVKITRKKGKKGGLRASQGYNSQSSLSADCESITASEVLRRRQQRKDFNKRHTLVGIENAEDLENLQFSPQTTSSGKVKESPVIMDYLKKKYPEHAERIDGRTSGSVMSNGFYETDLDNTDTMSEINTEATGFSRGGRLRSSMPVVRSVVNKTKEKPLGLIFLQYKNETKRALMPNEVTGIDTVRALYVRAFPKQLTMAMLEQPARKIYIMDPSTDIFYELENTDEIIDRTVLKIYEPGFVEDPNAPGPSSPRSTTSTPVELDYYSEPEVDHQKRDVRKNRYNTMTLPRTGASNMQPDGGARQQAAMGNLNPSQDRKHTGSLENFRRGTPERASATLQRPVAQNQAFQRLAPERATLSGPVQRGPGPGHGPGPQGPYGRRGPPPNQQGSATMPRRMPQHDPHHGLGPRPQGSATIPRSQKGGGPTMVDGRPSGGDMRRMDVTPVSKRPQPQVMSAPMPNGHPRQRGPPPQQHPHQQTPPGRPMGPHGTLPRNGAPGMRHPMPNGTGPGPGHPRGQAPLRRHGSHDGTFQDRPHSAPSVDEVLGMRAGGHQAGPQRPYSQPAPLPPMRSHSMEENTNERISAMEQQIANLAGMVRSVIGTRNGSPRKGPPPQDGQRPAGDHRPVPPVRADAMPITQQAMPITQQPRTPTHQPPLHSRTPDGHSRTPDSHLRPSSHPGAPTSPRGPGVNLQRSAMVMKHRVTDLRMQLKQVRKMHLNMVQQMNNNFKSTSHKIRMALEGAPGSDIHPIRNERAKVHQEYLRYLQTQETIERELRELDENVDKLRDHTINKRGNVNLEEIDQLAQLLGNSSRRIAEQKVNFPVLAEKLKTVQEGEMEIVVREENWMKHEPQRLDDHFKRCKKVTSTLYTLKRMAATHDEPYVISPTLASVSPSTTLTSKHVVRVDTAPYPQSAVIQRQTILDDEAEPVVRHDLPHRFKSPLERDLFEQTLSETKGALRQTHNVDANTVRHRRTLRELFDQENHDTMTPIITPEKAAKREAQKEAAATGPSSQKKGPPPPPPPRKHFPASPVPEQSNKKITWSSTQTTPTNKVPSDRVEPVATAPLESRTESVTESEPDVVERVAESERTVGRREMGEVGGCGGAAAGSKVLCAVPSTSADCLIHAVSVDPPPITNTIKSQETSKSTPSLGVKDTPQEVNGSFHSQNLASLGNGGVSHSSDKVAKEPEPTVTKSQSKKSFLSRSPSKSGQQGSSNSKSKSKKMGGALARLLRRDHEKGDSAQKANSPNSKSDPPPKPPRGCMDSPTQQTKKLFIRNDGNVNNNAKQVTIPQRSGSVANQGRMAKSAENLNLSSSPEDHDLHPPEGIYNVQQQQIIQDSRSLSTSALRNTAMTVAPSSPERTLSESSTGESPKSVPSSVETKRRDTEPSVRPKAKSMSAGLEDSRTLQLKAQYAKLRQMQIENNAKEKASSAQCRDSTDAEKKVASQPAVAMVTHPNPEADRSAAECNQTAPSAPQNEKTKLKSPPPVAAKPQSMKTTTRTTTTTTTTRSAYQVEDVNQALDELESLAFKATDTEDSLDSQAIKDSSPSSPNGTIQKPVHAHIRLPQSPSRSFATKPKPLSPRGDKSTTPSKVGGKTSAFVPIKATGPSPKKKEIKPSQQTPSALSSSSSAATSSPSPQQPLATSTPAGKTSSTPVHPSVSSPTAKVEEAKPVNVSTEMKPVEPSTVSITLCSKQVTSRSSQEQKGTVVVKEMTTSSSLSPFASTDLDDFCNSNREEGKNVVAKPESQSKNDENGSKLDKTSQDTVNQGVSNEEVPKVSQSVNIGDRDKMRAEVPTKLTNGNHVEKTVPHTTEIKTIIVNGIIEETSFD